MNPHCAPRLYILTHPSPQVAVQRPQRRRKEGAQRRGGQRHRDRVLARKGRTEKVATMHGVCGTLCGTQKLECTVQQRLGISGAGRSPPRAPSAAPQSIFSIVARNFGRLHFFRLKLVNGQVLKEIVKDAIRQEIVKDAKLEVVEVRAELEGLRPKTP